MQKKIDIGAHRKALNKGTSRKAKPAPRSEDDDIDQIEETDTLPHRRNNYFKEFGPEDREFVLAMKHYFEDASAIVLGYARRGVAEVASYIEEFDRRRERVVQQQDLLIYNEEHAIFDGGEAALQVANAIEALVGPGRLPSQKIGAAVIEQWHLVQYNTCAAVIYRADVPGPGPGLEEVKLVWDADVVRKRDVLETAALMRERLVLAKERLERCIEDIRVFTEVMRPMLKVPVQKYKINIVD